MAKIHLLVKKEDISEEKILEGNKVAVVLDILLATTTIVSALKDGAKEVIPVLNSSEASDLAGNFMPGTCLLAGELDAKPIDGFLYPSPTLIRENVKGKTLILSTTNGTVALRKAASAKKVYVASILNNPAVAETLANVEEEQTVLIICSGNSGELSLEDFYGSGHLIDCLVKTGQHELTDAAKAAMYFYRGQEHAGYEIFVNSYVGRLLEKYDQHPDLKLAVSKGITSIVPIMKNGKVVIETACTV